MLFKLGRFGFALLIAAMLGAGGADRAAAQPVMGEGGLPALPSLPGLPGLQGSAATGETATPPDIGAGGGSSMDAAGVPLGGTSVDGNGTQALPSNAELESVMGLTGLQASGSLQAIGGMQSATAGAGVTGTGLTGTGLTESSAGGSDDALDDSGTSDTGSGGASGF